MRPAEFCPKAIPIGAQYIPVWRNVSHLLPSKWRSGRANPSPNSSPDPKHPARDQGCCKDGRDNGQEWIGRTPQLTQNGEKKRGDGERTDQENENAKVTHADSFNPPLVVNCRTNPTT